MWLGAQNQWQQWYSYKSLLKLLDNNDILTRVFLSYLTTLYSKCFINFRKSLVSSLETGLFTSSVKSTTYFLFAFFYFSSYYGLKHLSLWVRPLTWFDALGYVVKWPPNKVNNNLESQKSGLIEPWPEVTRYLRTKGI